MVTDITELPQDEEYVIRFHAQWCAPCKAFEPVYKDAATETLIPFYDVDIEEALDLVREFKVMSIPAVFFVSNGVKRKLRTTNSVSTFVQQFTVEG